MHNNPTKICEICHVAFTPDPRVGERQRVCWKRSCQLERKRRAQKKWLAKNPDAFQDRYPKLQQWLADNPGYLKNYRARQKQLTATRDIQDELTGCQNSSLTALRQLLDMQDEITTKITACKHRLQELSALICKTSQLPKTAALNGA